MKTVKKVILEEIEEKSTLSDRKDQVSSRRTFLKKAVYSAPVLMAMGQLAKPTNVQADGSVPPPPPPW
ncbi:MAG TPA: hypothetical protein EYH42_10095 [Sulfurovum sp.]|nr:hypothetical protein [Sulfurovum sp.]